MKQLFTSLRAFARNKILIPAISVAGIMILFYYIAKSSNDIKAMLDDTSPDNLTAYKLNEDQIQILDQWKSIHSDVDQKDTESWVHKNSQQLLNIGLRLSEQATIFKGLEDTTTASTKLDLTHQIGQALAETKTDSFLLNQTEFIECLDWERLEIRAKASITAAKARDLMYSTENNEAFKNYQKAYQLAKRIKDNKLIVETGVYMQYLASLRDDSQLIIDIGQEIITMAEEIGYKNRLSDSYIATADAYYERGEGEVSQELLEKAKGINELAGDSTRLTRTYYSLAETSYFLQEYQQSDYFIKKLNNIDIAGSHTGQSLLLQGKISAMYGEYSSADSLYALALKYFRNNKQYLNEATTLDNLSLLRYQTGAYESAIQFANQGLQIKGIENYPSQVSSLINTLGLIYSDMDSVELALITFQDALKFHSTSKKSNARIWLSMGATQLRKGDLLNAKDSFEKAEKLANEINSNLYKIEAQVGLGHILQNQNQADDAIYYFNSAYLNAQEINELSLVADALYGLSIGKKSLSKLDDATDHINEAIEIVENLRSTIEADSHQVSYFATTQDFFDQAIDLSLAHQDTILAFTYSERARARALLDALGPAALKEFDQDKDLLFLTSKFDELILNVPTTAQIIEYRINPEHLHIWLIENNKLTFHKIDVTSIELEQHIVEFLASLGAKDLASFKNRVAENIMEVYDENRSFGAALYSLIFKPIEKEINSNKELLIIPDGILHSLPFGALVTSKNKFFDQQYTWAKAPSLSVLSQNKNWYDKPNAKNEFLMIAGDLPSVPSEKRFIKNNFNSPIILEKEKATYSNLKEHSEDGTDIIYFSVHAVSDAQYPMNSYMLFFEHNEDDKQHYAPISARKLMELDFTNTKLVVLNACETASGKITKGEGVLNMVRIFSLEQVPTVVASLWKNDDRHSSEIIQEFFTGINLGKRASEALQGAKNKTIKELEKNYKYPLPYFWAVFESYVNQFENPINIVSN